MALLRLLAACDKTDAPPQGLSDPAATATASDSTEAGADDAELARYSPPPVASSSARPRAAVATADGGPTPESAPLLFWMRDHTAAALRQNDSAALASALEQLATFAPKDPAYANWASIARDGADAARAGSVEGVRAACRGCHGQYRAPYKATMRSRPLAP